MIETVLRSEDLPVTDRFEWWRELTSHTLMPTEITSDHADDFRACIRQLDLGAVQVSVLSSVIALASHAGVGASVRP
ncbi:hypothetical protein G9272_37160 [Streptomyces asoensis]|uniref:Transcription regulator HTH AraC- type ligand binding domain-containing protein n=1 Tax=Streptomyces asoensis TaxID=249586 RepID=A0A6M4X0A2_9ACTN|nr:hypothetical protein [Streptomyces asoensis]QJT05241.1 hypothetical protein G9272_37160 [Streptomyces asoensis]